MGAMICPLCGTGFMPPSANPNPAPYGAYPNAPMGQVPLPPHPLSNPVAPAPLSEGPAIATSGPSRKSRGRSKGNPLWSLVSVALGGALGVGVAGYLISRTNFITQMRQDLGVEKSPEQLARERSAIEKSLGMAPEVEVKGPDHPVVPNERAQPNAAPSSTGTRTTDSPNQTKGSFAKIAGESGGEQPTEEMPDDSSVDPLPGPPRVTFADLIDPETGKPRPGKNGKTGQGQPSAVADPPRPRVIQRGVALPALDDKSTVEVLALGADQSFSPQHFRLLSSAAQLPSGAEFVVSPTTDEKGCVVAYRASASATATDVAEFRASGKTVAFSWVEGNTPDEIREQLRNTLVAYTTPTGVKHVALRKSQVIDRAVLDLERDRTDWTWTIETPPKGSEMYIEFGSVANLPHNAEMRGSYEIKVGARGFIAFRDFPGAQLAAGSSFKKGEMSFSLTPEFVERDGDHFSLAEPRLDEFEKTWKDAISRNTEKLAQFDAQAAAASALIDRIESSTAANPAEAAAMVVQKRTAAQKIQGLRSRKASTIKASKQLEARLEALPKVREAVNKLKNVAMPPFVIYAKVGSHRIELLEHNP